MTGVLSAVSSSVQVSSGQGSEVSSAPTLDG